MAFPLAGFLVGSAFGRFLAIVIGAVIGRIIIAFGLTIVTYTGAGLAFQALKDEFDALLATAPGALITLLEIGGFLNAVNMMFAAFMAVVTVRFVGGALKSVKLV